MKRIISILISISMLLMSVPVFAISGTGTESNPYLISTASDIAKIHNDLNGYYKLTTNINMSGVEFEPIGNENEGAFTGIIDGDGYTISNLNINLPENKYVGFVGYLEGTVKNLKLTNVKASGYRYVGGLVGYAEENSIVNNCSVNGDICGIYNIIDVYVGGVVGYAVENSEIYSCTMYGSVCGEFQEYATQIGYIGGISGYSDADIFYCTNNAYVYQSVSNYGEKFMGGIVGYSTGEITGCDNHGDFGEGLGNIGGISGYNTGSITNCNNYGSFDDSVSYGGGITGRNKGIISRSSNHGVIKGTYSGGIAGENAASIENCENYGSIEGTYSGGVAGYNGKSVLSCVNYGDITKGAWCGGIVGHNLGSIEYCVNSGTITATSQAVYYRYYSVSDYSSSAAGIAGHNENTIQNCYNNGGVENYYYTTGRDDVYVCAAGIATNENGIIKNCINSGKIISSVSYNSHYNYAYSSGICSVNLRSESTTSKLEISDCINSGYVYAYHAYSDSYAYVNSSNAYQLSNIGTISPNTDYKKIKSFNGFKEKSSFENLDFINIWDIESLTNSGFPQLQSLPEHIKLNESVKIMEVGDTGSLYAYIDGNSERVTWSCQDDSIATVLSNGTVVAKSIGATTVTATNSNGMKANCLIYVYGKASSVELSCDEINIDQGKTSTIKALQSPSEANETVIWYSENENIATVSQTGMITAISKGTTNIYAVTTSSNIRAECTVNVYAPITSITLSTTSKTVKLGTNDVITATISPSDYEGNITWSSSDENIVTVNQEGKIYAKNLGTANIICSSDSGLTATCSVTVKQPATNIGLNQSAITTYVGSTYQLSANVLPLDTTDTVTWSSSSTSYATVSSTGLVTGKNVGTATITATTTNGLTAKCVVTIKATQVLPTTLSISDRYLLLAPDDTKLITATLEPSNVTETLISWTSSNENVAIVSNTGVVTAKANGFATIKAITSNGISAECVIKVASADGPTVILNSIKASPGGTAQVKANIVKNPGLSAYKFKVNYDADVLSPVSITPNVEFGGTFSTNLDDADRTGLNVLWYSGNEDVAINGELFTVNFKVNDSAAYGDSSIVSIEYGATDICDVSGNYIAIYTEDATVSITDPRPGDIYEDSDVNVYDLTLLSRYITSLETFTARQEEAADVNNDGRVDILDVIRLAQYLVNWSGIELMSLDLYDEPTTPVISVGSASVNELNEAEIPVYIKNNSGILGYRFVLDYNAEDIEILSITPSELINKDGFNHNLGAESQATDGLVVSCFTSGNNITDDGVLFTVKVRYKNPADTSVSPISVVDSFDNMGNENATYVTATYETGYALGDDYIVTNRVVGDTNFSCELYFDDSYAEQSAKAIIAFYDGDGRMVQLMPKDITVKPGKVDLSIDYDKKAYATYKLMIWEGMSSLKPITDVK